MVAHILPADSPVLDDRSLCKAMAYALAASEAADSVPEWRDGRLYHAGDPMGRLLAWTWAFDAHLCMEVLAHYHRNLEHVVGQTIDLEALMPGFASALTVSLDSSQIAEFQRHTRRLYHDYHPTPGNHPE